MNRLAPFAFSFLLAFAAVGCATTYDDGTLGSGSQNEEEGDDDEARADLDSANEDGVLPAAKLLPEGAVKTVNACTDTGSAVIVDGEKQEVTRGTGKITRTTRDATGFHGVGVRGAATVIVTEGTGFGVQVETDDNLQGLITTTVSEKGNLVVESKGSYCTNGGVRVIVTMPKIENAAIDGSGTIEATKAKPSDVTLAVFGSGALQFRGDAAALTAVVDGSGTIVLKEGSASTTKASVEGSGVITGKSFAAGTVTKQVDGSGAIQL